jgi:hypothetical protein
MNVMRVERGREGGEGWRERETEGVWERSASINYEQSMSENATEKWG